MFVLARALDAQIPSDTFALADELFETLPEVGDPEKPKLGLCWLGLLWSGRRWMPHSSRAKKNGASVAKLPEQEHDEDDEQNQTETAAAVVAESWSHAIPAEAEHQNQNNQKDNHCFFLRSAKIRQMEV